ncbi:MAG: 50S ribosomal protein L9 [Zetaproteobacteria bacterium CG_4_9_14_3_um_filter_49_83]|nr:MAG: 50S ribosomal protein L9 [Zetaproteobacteria bacterium CG1_02_49_23]PIQ32685.1 MAG: 50S ribosomal protein L9 [Zetaproteobacteria bacterium CG17_big_fil_post_rev_8_21_14_2_50_50_13]PIV30758.1 MAG: 50S ribosomal protein L9 [Zetaproteobacteria bacterium CG02_land_8_20_14_3_00_50_9]PIY55290.1 MAG: 50S ribosomal protein L9 [Zetaproteobacteria bacterium CG_4_10_14_0_8_um_filter_49_80]PJA36102.1 MAG: 50S ribosomal protein L9 [Zetaproteobacteria bacterium CG_4_9_14_3_um_filter_49_83]
MQLILLERVEGLGNVGDEVSVKNGFGRNFLLPQQKATIANEANRKLFERRRKILEEKQKDELEKAKAISKNMATLELSITRATSDNKHLYGSVSTNDIAELLKGAGYSVERRFILLDEHIKSVGEHTVRVRLHPDVIAEIKLQVQAEAI